MKVLMINGSPNEQGNTYLALAEVAKALNAEGVETEIEWIGKKAVQGCIACRKCRELGRCVFHDDLYETLRERLADRLFYSTPAENYSYKPAASVAVARRGGAATTFDRLNKYFTISNMPVVSSQYWNIVYGQMPGQAVEDGEGMQTMRTLGRNMAWLLRKIHNPAPDAPTPEQPRVFTNFIR